MVGALYSSRNVFWIKGGWLGLHVRHFMIKYLFVRKRHHFLNRSGLSVCLCVCPYMSAVYCLLSPPVSDENVSVTKYEHFLMWTPMWVTKNWLWQRMSTFQSELSDVGAKFDIENTQNIPWMCLTESLTFDPTLDLIAHISYSLTDRLFWIWLFMCVYGASDRAIPRVICPSKMYPPNCNRI